MATTLNFKASAVATGFSDPTYTLQVYSSNRLLIDFNTVVTFGDNVSRLAAIDYITTSLNGNLDGNPWGYIINSVSLVEGTDTITFEVDFDCNSEMIMPTNNDFPLGYEYFLAELEIRTGDNSSQIAFSQSLLQSTPVDCTPIACDECNDKVMSACESSYKIIAGLDAGTSYTVAMTDRNEVKYIQEVVADGSGDLTIDALAPEFPQGAFTPEYGGFTIEVFEDTDMTVKSVITEGIYFYGCVKLSFQHTVTTTSSLIPSFNYLVTDTLDFVITEYGNTFICN